MKAARAKSSVLVTHSLSPSKVFVPVDMRVVFDGRLLAQALPDPLDREIFLAETEQLAGFLARKFRRILLEMRRARRAKTGRKRIR